MTTTTTTEGTTSSGTQASVFYFKINIILFEYHLFAITLNVLILHTMNNTIRLVTLFTGGSCTDTDNGAKDNYYKDCSYYTSCGSNPSCSHTCGAYDDDDFSANQMCCFCGAGGKISWNIVILYGKDVIKFRYLRKN